MRKNGDFKNDLDAYQKELAKALARIAASLDEVDVKRQKAKAFPDQGDLDPSLAEDDAQLTAALSAARAVELSPPTAVWPC